ncbi:hypothetical protein K435DRAFT_962853 [Dendrothele bispora CBS 962.96]|uniref:Uncharacterized protein n=1 Tax=Dendrothele bispora (strain CBS 962.96) TaxID=1314807 RepID=A0A4S8MJC2_DENBC|nr:hypothetical protein K435DRAFT_962853 [Dendrothele bispora CBS 962.96]
MTVGEIKAFLTSRINPISSAAEISGFKYVGVWGFPMKRLQVSQQSTRLRPTKTTSGTRSAEFGHLAPHLAVDQNPPVSRIVDLRIRSNGDLSMIKLVCQTIFDPKNSLVHTTANYARVATESKPIKTEHLSFLVELGKDSLSPTQPTKSPVYSPVSAVPDDLLSLSPDA